MVDTQGRLVFANEAARRVMAHLPSADEPFAGQTDAFRLRDEEGELLTPEDTPLNHALHGRTVADRRIIVAKPDGGDAHVSTAASPVTDDAGRMIGAMVVFRDISAQKETERQLRQTTSELQAIFSAYPDLSFRITANGTILDYHAGHDGDLYHPPEDFLGKRMQDVLPLDAVKMLERACREASATGTVVAVEYALPMPQGDQVYEARLAPIPDKQLMVVVRNITQRRRAEKELAASEANYRAIFDAVNDAIFVHDPQTGAILDVNHKMTEMYGYTREEARHLDIATVSGDQSPQTQQIALQLLHKATAGEPQVFEWLAKDKAGRQFWVEVSIKRAKIGDQERLLAIVRDITERKRAEEERERLARAQAAKEEAEGARQEIERILAELRESEERYRALAEAAQDQIFVIGKDERIEYVNQVAARLLGKPREAIVGQREADLFPEEQAEHQLRNLKEVFRTGKPMYVEEKMAFPRRELWQGVWLAPIKNEAGEVRAMLGVARDITKRKEAEQFRDEYVSLISHDLRGPLTPISGMAQWLWRSLKAKGLTLEADSAMAIVRNADRMRAMIQDLVESARLEAGRLELHKEPVDLLRLVSSIGEKVGTLGDRERIQVESPDWVPPVIADPERIERAIVNLVTNALKYSGTDQAVVVGLHQAADEAVVSVADQGPGIEQEAIPHLFERFYRAPNSQKAEGLGLGLYIARLIAEAHGGRVWVESELGKGSVFHLALPLAR